MKSVYKVCLLALVMLPWALNLGAQPKSDRKGRDPEFWKKAKAAKVEFITKRLALSSKESAEFLKVYNESETRKGELFHARKEALVALKKALKAEQPKDVESLLKNYLDAQERLAEWESSDYERFSKVLSKEKFAALVVAEEDFRRQQIHRLDGKKGRGPGMPPQTPKDKENRGGRNPKSGLK